MIITQLDINETLERQKLARRFKLTLKKRPERASSIRAKPSIKVSASMMKASTSRAHTDLAAASGDNLEEEEEGRSTVIRVSTVLKPQASTSVQNEENDSPILFDEEVEALWY